MANEHSTANTRCSRQLLALVVAVNTLALAATAFLSPASLFDRPVTLITLIVLALVVGTRSIRIPRLDVYVIAADAFVFFALIALTPAAAPLVAAASVVGSAVGQNNRFLSIKTAFNLGAVSLSVAAGAWVYVMLGGSSGGVYAVLGGSGGAAVAPSALPLVAAAVTYALFNVPLTATAVHLGTGRSWGVTVRESIGFAVVSNITCAMLGIGLLFVALGAGPAGLALGLVPLLPLEQYIRSHVRRGAERRPESKVVLDLDDAPPATTDSLEEEPQPVVGFEILPGGPPDSRDDPRR